MNTRTTALLGMILVVAVGFIILSKTLGNGSSEEALFFPDVTVTAIGKVLIADADNRVTLKRTGDRWEVIAGDAALTKEIAPEKPAGIAGLMGGDSADAKPAASPASYPADSGMIANLLEKLTTLSKDILISENPEKQAMFEVDSATGIGVEFFDGGGKRLGAIYIGKSASDYNSSYVRSARGRAVYQVRDLMRSTFTSDHKRWTDKQVLPFDKSGAVRISLARQGEPEIVLSKESDTAGIAAWRMVSPDRKVADTLILDSTKVDELLTALSTLRAAEYVEEPISDTATGLVDPSIAISVELAGKSLRQLVTGVKEEGGERFYGKVPGRPYIYLINDADWKKFDRSPESFFKPAAGTIEAVPAPIPEKYR